MEQAYSEMFLAEPEPRFRLSRQHLCYHYNKLKMGSGNHNQELSGTAQFENGQKSGTVPKPVYINPSIGKEGGH